MIWWKHRIDIGAHCGLVGAVIARHYVIGSWKPSRQWKHRFGVQAIGCGGGFGFGRKHGGALGGPFSFPLSFGGPIGGQFGLALFGHDLRVGLVLKDGGHDFCGFGR